MLLQKNPARFRKEMLAPRHRKTHRRGKTKAENSISVEEPYYCNESMITSERLQGRAATASLAAVTHSALILAPGLARGAGEGLLKHHLYL